MSSERVNLFFLQIYCDSITQEPELQDWVTESSPAKKMKIPLTDEIRFAVDRYYFSYVVVRVTSYILLMQFDAVIMCDCFEAANLQLRTARSQC